MPSSTIKEYQERQHLEWLGHCVRMENSTLQKQMLFMVTTAEQGKRRQPDRWLRIERVVGMDKGQLLRIMKERSRFK